jgi:hypothetical protein
MTKTKDTLTAKEVKEAIIIAIADMQNDLTSDVMSIKEFNVTHKTIEWAEIKILQAIEDLR